MSKPDVYSCSCDALFKTREALQRHCTLTCHQMAEEPEEDYNYGREYEDNGPRGASGQSSPKDRPNSRGGGATVLGNQVAARHAASTEMAVFQAVGDVQRQLAELKHQQSMEVEKMRHALDLLKLQGELDLSRERAEREKDKAVQDERNRHMQEQARRELEIVALQNDVKRTELQGQLAATQTRSAMQAEMLQQQLRDQADRAKTAEENASKIADQASKAAAEAAAAKATAEAAPKWGPGYWGPGWGPGYYGHAHNRCGNFIPNSCRVHGVHLCCGNYWCNY